MEPNCGEQHCCLQKSISPPPSRVPPRVQAHTRSDIFSASPDLSEIELVTPSQQAGMVGPLILTQTGKK